MQGWVYTVVRRLGLSGLVWNRQYRKGRASEFEAKSPTTLDFVRRHAKGGRIVELGCGEGALPANLPDGSFASYVGIDISSVAIEHANAKGLARCEFRVGTLEEWPGEHADLVVIEEALYYLSARAQRDLLDRCLRSVRPAGVVLVVVHDAGRHADSLERARNCGTVVEQRTNGTRAYVVVA